MARGAHVEVVALVQVEHASEEGVLVGEHRRRTRAVPRPLVCPEGTVGFEHTGPAVAEIR